MWALIDHHVDHDSPLHRWHPTIKLVGIVALIVAAAAVTRPGVASVAAGIAIGGTLLTRLPITTWLRHLRGVLLVVVLLAGLAALTGGGTSVAQLGPLHIGAEGLRLGVLLGVKALAIMLLALALLVTTPLAQLGQALERLGAPARLVQILLLALRMNLALGAEIERVQAALASRGFRWRPTPLGLRTAGRVAGSVLVRALERGERVHDAMCARGYVGRTHYLPAAPPRAGDWIGLVAALGVAVALLLVNGWAP
jgi:cobalt/nickel transport system permease protein